MVRFGEKEVAKEKFYAAKKNYKNNVDNIVIAKLIETKTKSKYFNGIKNLVNL